MTYKEVYYMEKLYKRELYLSKIRPFYKDEDMIKVLTGVRRCGKSSMMQLICNELLELMVQDNLISVKECIEGLKRLKLDRTRRVPVKLIDSLIEKLEEEYLVNNWKGGNKNRSFRNFKSNW